MVCVLDGEDKRGPIWLPRLAGLGMLSSKPADSFDSVNDSSF